MGATMPPAYRSAAPSGAGAASTNFAMAASISATRGSSST